MSYHAFCIFQPDGSITAGVPPVFIPQHDCDSCGQIHDLEKCPLCGSYAESGFGLAYGGFGGYWYCSGDVGDSNCPWFWKKYLGGTIQ